MKTSKQELIDYAKQKFQDKKTVSTKEWAKTKDRPCSKNTVYRIFGNWATFLSLCGFLVPKTRKPRTKKPCEHCGKETLNPKFCSQTCGAVYNNKKFPKRERKPYFCVVCGDNVKYKRKYCDSCFKKREVERETGNLTLEEATYKVGQASNRYAKVRDHYKKMYLGKYTACFSCGYSKHVEICHIKAITEFSKDTKISVVNAPENITILCPNCHWEFDHNLKKKEDLKRISDI
jgi:hypothetical protein